MLRVGITGGIGSGKSTVCHIFALLGIPIYDADSQAKRLMEHDPTLRTQIEALLGHEAYLSSGPLNRPWIAERVFGYPELLQQLNALVHPAVGRHSDEWHHQQTNVPYTLYEAALLFESGGYRKMNRMITVTAPLELRIQRVMARDHTERAAVEARIARQMPEEDKVAQSDMVIHNDGQQSLIQQVLDIHRRLCLEQANTPSSVDTIQ